MKKLTIFTFLFALTTMVWAQQKDTLRLHVNGNEIIILTDDINNLSHTDYNAIIQKLTNETQIILEAQQAEFAKIDERQKAGEITPEEAAEMKSEVSENTGEALEELSEEIEQWADEYGEAIEENAEDYEEWADQWESNAKKYENTNPPPPPPPAPDGEGKSKTIIINDDGIRVETDGDWDPDEYKDVTQKYKSNRTYGTFEMHFGWNNWFDANGMAVQTVDNPLMTTEPRFWQSTTWGFGFGGKTRLGDNSKIYLRYGLQFNWHYFRLRGNTIVNKVSTPEFDGINFAPDPDQNKNYSRSTLRINYLDVPIMFEFDNSKRGRSNGFSFGLGGYGGVRLNSSAKTHYDDFNGDGTKSKVNNNFYANPFRYGVQAQIGIGTFKITGKYDLNKMFRDDRQTPDYQIASLTFGFVFP